MRKTRLSYFATKALLGSSIALLGTQLNAVDIAISNQDDFEQYFERDSDNDWSFQGNPAEDNTITFNADGFRFGDQSRATWFGLEEGATLTLKGGGNDEILYNLDVGEDDRLAGKTIIDSLAIEFVGGEQHINSDLEIKNRSELVFMGGSYGGRNFDSKVYVKGDLSVTDSLLSFFGGGFIKTDKAANITNSTFELIKDSFTALEANNLTLIEAKSFNDTITNNTIYGGKTISFRDYVSDSALLNEIYKDAKTTMPEDVLDLSSINGVALAEYDLEVKDGKLVANGGATEEAYKTENQVAFDKAAIERLKEYIDNEEYEGDYEWSDALVTRLQAYLTEAKTALDSIDATDDRAYINAVTGGLNNEDMTAALALRGIADSLGALGADLMSREGIQLAIDIKNDTQENGKSASNFTQATNTTISVANDMSISSRIAMQNILIALMQQSFLNSSLLLWQAILHQTT